ncbi:zinc-binding alcohol dehydrogenase family protein [Paraburkholderia xenovorans]|uniref:quinone oxidoreductase family protein n=1 Tax=Paraburkholderia xenovorans TaxID=36873 RepID=UPI0038BB75B3
MKWLCEPRKVGVLRRSCRCRRSNPIYVFKESKRMKAAVYYQNGGPEVFRYEDISEPECGPDEVVIRVEAISIEGGDLVNREIRPLARVPHIVGYQCAGTVIEAGNNVRDRHVGDRVVAVLSWGSHAQFAAAPAADTWIVPDGLALDTAAAIPVAWGTAYECLFSAGKLKKGETVLIHAGAGALGLAAIQLAKRAGAHVLATASDDSRLERLKPFGLDVGINYKNEDFVEKVLADTDGRGADVVLDSIAGKNLVRSIQSLAYGGRAITVGVSGRDSEKLDPVSLWRGNNSLHGVYFPSILDRDHERAHGQVQEILASVARGELSVVIDQVFSLQDAEQAHRYVLSRRAFGRVLLRP